MLFKALVQLAQRRGRTGVYDERLGLEPQVDPDRTREPIVEEVELDQRSSMGT